MSNVGLASTSEPPVQAIAPMSTSDVPGAKYYPNRNARRRARNLDICPVAGQAAGTAANKCTYFLRGKGRNCNFDAMPGQVCCGNHLFEVTKQGSRRVPCPADPSHKVLEEDMAWHLRRCNKAVEALRDRTQPCYVADYNAGSEEEADLTPVFHYNEQPNVSLHPALHSIQHSESGLHGHAPAADDSAPAINVSSIATHSPVVSMAGADEQPVQPRFGDAADPESTGATAGGKRPSRRRNALQDSLADTSAANVTPAVPTAAYVPAFGPATAALYSATNGLMPLQHPFPVKQHKGDIGLKLAADEMGPFGVGKTARRLRYAEAMGAEAFQRLVDKVASAYALECAGREPEEQVFRPPESEQLMLPNSHRPFSIKHAVQQASIMGSLKAAGLLPLGPRGVLLELGAGKGYLGCHIAEASSVGGVVLADRRSCYKNKADRSLRHLELRRVQVDLKDMYLPGLIPPFRHTRTSGSTATPVPTTVIATTATEQPASADTHSVAPSRGTNDAAAAAAPATASKAALSVSEAVVAQPQSQHALGTFPDPWLAVGKHLCGAATDYVLRCCCGIISSNHSRNGNSTNMGCDGVSSSNSSGGAQGQSDDSQGSGSCTGGLGIGSTDSTGSAPAVPPVAVSSSGGAAVVMCLQGFAVATCCHHRCSWRSYVGKALMRRCGFSAAEFEMISWMTGWALCGHEAPSDGLEPSRRRPRKSSSSELGSDSAPPQTQSSRTKAHTPSVTADASGRDIDAQDGTATAKNGQQNDAYASEQPRRPAGSNPRSSGKAMAAVIGSGSDSDTGSSDGRSRRDGKPEPETDSDCGDPHAFDVTRSLPREQRILLGQKCKQLIDRGRLEWLKAREGLADVRYTCYVPATVSGENKLLLAVAAGRSSPTLM